MTELQPAAAPDTFSSVELSPGAEQTQNPVSYKPDPAPEKPEAPKLTARQALEKAAADVQPKAEVKAEEKPEPPKPDTTQKPVPENPPPAAKAEESEPATSEQSEVKGDEQVGKQEPRSSEERDIEKPPARFLPRAKEKWGTVDPDVKGEVHRAFAEMQKGLDESRESREFRKELREFEEMAKTAGVPLKDAIKNYVELDNLVARDPVAGVARILNTQGIDVVQFAEHVLQHASQQTPQSQELSRLQQHIQGLEQQLQQVTQQTQQTVQQTHVKEVLDSVIAPFRQTLGANDRFDELEADIAFFLNSDKVPFDEPPIKRLQTAYDYAERINPSPVAPLQGVSTPETSALRPLNPAGQKSIKGSPGLGAPAASRDKGRVSTRDALKAAASELGVRI